MEMHCRAGWLEVVRNVEEAEQIEGGYDAQVRSELIRAVGDGETCSVCTAMITNELLPDAPTQVSTSGWDKGSASSTFAFCNGLDTAARKDLCSATVPFIMELAQTEALTAVRKSKRVALDSVVALGTAGPHEVYESSNVLFRAASNAKADTTRVGGSVCRRILC